MLRELIKVGSWVRESNYSGRSGHAPGSDLAFEIGCKEACTVYLPWADFNKEAPFLGKPLIVKPRPDLDEMVRKFHPNPGALSRGAFALMRRNSCQVLGLNLDQPSDVVVAYRNPSAKTSGTDQAIRIASDRKIEVLNLALPQWNSAGKIIARLTEIAKQKLNP